MAWFKSLGYGNSGGTTPPPRLWILNPDVSSAVYSSAIYDQSRTSYVPYLYKIYHNSTKSPPYFNRVTSFNGVNDQAVIYREGYDIGTIFFLQKIPKNIYTKLYVECEVLTYGIAEWIWAAIYATSDFSLNANDMPESILKTAILTASSKTSSEINNQPGVVINSVDNLLLDAQTVEIDISEITEDFYIASCNCDRILKIRSIYLE
jgi:hypothetical protein